MAEVKQPVTATVQKFEPQMVEQVLTRVNQLKDMGGLVIPKDYSAENALRSAWLTIQDQKDSANMPVLKSCTPASIQNSLFRMVVDGLSVAKHQCSFIPRGGKLTLQREYAGSIALAKRFGGMKDIFPGVIYEKDIFEYNIDAETGKKKITNHKQNFENIDESKIRGAYAVIIMEDGTTNLEVMTIAQIRRSWENGPSKGKSPAHLNFPGAMAGKTVINRACKLLIASSDDSVLMEEGEDGRMPRERTKFEAPDQQGQVIDIPDEEPIQIAEEVKDSPELKKEVPEQPEPVNSGPSF